MISLGLASGLVAFLVHSIFDTALYSPQVLTLFLIIVAYSVIARSPSKGWINSTTKQSRLQLENTGLLRSARNDN